MLIPRKICRLEKTLDIIIEFHALLPRVRGNPISEAGLSSHGRISKGDLFQKAKPSDVHNLTSLGKERPYNTRPLLCKKKYMYGVCATFVVRHLRSHRQSIATRRGTKREQPAARLAAEVGDRKVVQMRESGHNLE